MTVPSTADERTTATFRLFRALGLHIEIGQMLDGNLPPLVSDEERWAALSSLLWESGRWSTLRRQWRRQRPSVERDERIGACLWSQGRYLPAYLWLESHRRRRPPGPERQMLAETAGRVVEHMSRVPDLRWLGRRLAGRAAQALGTPSSVDGLVTWRRRLDLLSSLQAIVDGSPRPVDDATTNSRWFEESGNLSGALAYRHRALRDAYASVGASSISPAEYLDQIGRAYALGTRAGAWQVVVLPGSERVLSFREVLASTVVLEYGWWHRLRVLINYIRRRLRSA